MKPDYSEETRKIPLSNLYLDANNYRFIDNVEYVKVTNEKLKDALVQKRTHNFLTGKGNEGIADLISSFKANGYLPVDQIQVRALDDTNTNYVVVEGNRRVCCLKYLQEKYAEGADMGNLNTNIFDEGINVVVTSGVDETHYKILMGLKHISGNKKWPAVNQAELLKSLLDAGMPKNEIKASLGISTIALNRYLKSLSLIEQYKESDFGDQFKTEKFNLFSELIKQPKIMRWLGWKEETYKAENEYNRNRFFSWISQEEDEENDLNQEAILTKGDDMRELAGIIEDEKLLERMELSRSVAQTYLASDSISKDKLTNILENLDKGLKDAFGFISHADNEHKANLIKIRQKFDGLLTAQGFEEIMSNKDIQRKIFVEFGNTQFSEITIKNYKQFKILHIPHLRQINLIGGDNNTGKSSLLEAIYALCVQNDVFALSDMYKRRGKYMSQMSSNGLQNILPSDTEIDGVFYDKKVQTSFFFEQEEDEDFDKSHYLNTLFVESYFEDSRSESRLRLFEKNTQSFFKSIHNICQVRYSSPFSIHSREDIYRSHARSVETKSIDKILAFIRENIDERIQNIELVGEGETQRFLVTHQDFEKAIDLTAFGDGLQRIFHITLLFASAKNGVLLIDEIENAIHHDLFVKFTRFIEDLAESFNVQLFITSHSKECIDAFFQNGNSNANIAAYSLEVQNGNTKLRHTEGEKFGRLIENFNTDLRL